MSAAEPLPALMARIPAAISNSFISKTLDCPCLRIPGEVPCPTSRNQFGFTSEFPLYFQIESVCCVFIAIGGRLSQGSAARLATEKLFAVNVLNGDGFRLGR